MKEKTRSVSALVAVAGALFAFGLAAPAAAQPAGGPIVLGVPTALGSIEGADSLRAVQMAVEEINAAGGVRLGGQQRPMQVVSIDTREHEAGIPVHDALAAVERLIAQHRPHAVVVGAFRSEVLLASMDLVARHRLPYIVTIGMTPAIQPKIVEEYDKYKYMFRTGLNASYFVRYLTQLTAFLGKEFGFDRATIVHQDVLWARATAGGLGKWMKENGWTVVNVDAYPTGVAEFSPSLTRARAGGAQVIVPIFDMPEAGVLVKQARAMRLPALVAGFISPVAPENAWRVFEGEVEGLVNFIFEIGPMPVAAVPASVDFNRKYGQRWGEDARVRLSGHGPGPSYDSVYILKDAIERAGTLEPDAIVAALEKTDYRGAIGRVRFEKDHQAVYGLDPGETAIGAAFQWAAPGKRVVVFPAQAAEGKITLPPYMKR
jgi:branched-chain amino acid transport system substrate-binding protein